MLYIMLPKTVWTYDVEILFKTIFNKFSCSAINVQSLKLYFDFVQLELKNVFKHISIRWGS